MFSNHTRICCAFMAATASVPAAYAQEGTNRFALEEVVITARKMEEGLQNAPLAVTAFTARELENRGAVDVTDIAASAPNVHFESGGATSGMSATPTVFIRGIGQSDFNINNDPAVGMYVDGIYMGRMLGSMTDLLDLERVEVLRGPQGTLFGRNSIGGAINLISKKPDPRESSGRLSLMVGERDLVFAKGAINVPLSSTAAVRASGFYREREGYVDAVQYDDLKLGGEETWGARLALRWEPTDAFYADFAIERSERNDPPAAIVPVALGNVSLNPGSGNVQGDNRSTMPSAFRFNTGRNAPNPNAPLPPPPAEFVSPDTETCSNQALVNTSLDCMGSAHVMGMDKVNSRWVDSSGNFITPEQQLEQQGVSMVLGLETSVGTLTLTSAYKDMDADFFNDNDFTPFIIFHNNNDEFSQDQMSYELQFTGESMDKISYVAGLYYFEESGRQTISLVAPMLPPAGAPPAAPTLPFLQEVNRDIDNESTAIYGQINYDFTQALHLTLGARYTENTKDIELGLFRGSRENPWITINESDSLELEETNILINLSYDLSDTSMVYVQFADGFRDGGWPVRFPGLPVGIPPLDTVEFGPEFVDSYEVGLKATFADNRFRVNAAIFSADYSDMQIQFSDPLLNGAPNTSNLGESTIKGLELEANWVATDNLRFDLSLGLLDADLKKVTGGQLATGADNVAGFITADNELPYTPEIQAAIGANYSVNLAGGALINSRVDWVYTDDQFFTIENSPLNFQEAYSKVNAKVSYIASDETWELAIGARNLTDKTYSTIGRTQSDSGSAFVNVARPRELYLQAMYRF
ncbi:TonB-dependent receptor [Haliea sp. E1-2-M8]|uniref:TonB-dependent receptor n=1 Tax=Haliea sp. E1-2-M8 TaxID=3064706 RepID=UPI0027208697|nr:TonB-dependent receptor [Haliea sp. E1-2-M8]MDO8863945.1 TonB-dependent receptor [Haliea sp. E1-2-M8]